MKARIIVLLLLVACAASLAALPKVAVLDAVLPENMDKNVSIGVTEKISEELVNSGKYTVLDRTTVGQSLKEIEFQMSGLVSDADIKKAGEQLNSRLGATYVVVGRVSQVGQTYFVSAKMIDIKTGEITAQASYESEGGIAVTLQIAQVVGKKLSVGAKESVQVAEEPTAAPAPAPKPTPEPEPAPAPKAPAPTPRKPSAGLKSHLILTFTYPIPSGQVDSYLLSYTVSSESISALGWSVHWLQAFGDIFYLSAAIDGASEQIDVSGTSYGFYDVFDGLIGAGIGLPIGGSFQAYLGVVIGYQTVTYGSFWIIPSPGSSQGDFCYGAEAGLDIILFNFLTLSSKFTITSMTFTTSDFFPAGQDLLLTGIAVGVGIAY